MSQHLKTPQVPRHAWLSAIVWQSHTVFYLVVQQWEEDQAPLPIRIKHKLLSVAAPHNISKAEVIDADARRSDSAIRRKVALPSLYILIASRWVGTACTDQHQKYILIRKQQSTWQIFAWQCSGPTHHQVRAPTERLFGPL